MLSVRAFSDLGLLTRTQEGQMLLSLAEQPDMRLAWTVRLAGAVVRGAAQGSK